MWAFWKDFKQVVPPDKYKREWIEIASFRVRNAGFQHTDVYLPLRKSRFPVRFSLPGVHPAVPRR